MKTTWLLLGVAATLMACAGIDPQEVTRGQNQTVYQGDRSELVKYGGQLWNDPKLGNSGLACQSCHMNGAQFKPSFKVPYPHKVRMASGKAGLTEIDAEQMVQLCMKLPMKAEPLPWDSRELAALSAYIDDVVQPEFAARHK